MANYIEENKEELFLIISFLVIFIFCFIAGYIKHIEVSKINYINELEKEIKDIKEKKIVCE